MSEFVLDVPKHLYRSWYRKEELWQESARAVHDLLCDVVRSEDLGGTALMDYGCGAKMSKLFLENDVPIKRYVGLDTNSELISFLQSSIHDDRFEYHHVNIHNEMYNLEGSKLSDIECLPVEGQTFDLISLFSVFTHLAPHDYQPLLRLLRRQAAAGTRLVYSIFLNEQSKSGCGFMDKWGPVVLEGVEIPPGAKTPEFEDFFPERPLEVAMYTRAYALSLLEGTGWKLEEIRDPTPHTQFVFVCAPE